MSYLHIIFGKQIVPISHTNLLEGKKERREDRKERKEGERVREREWEGEGRGIEKERERERAKNRIHSYCYISSRNFDSSRIKVTLKQY